MDQSRRAWPEKSPASASAAAESIAAAAKSHWSFQPVHEPLPPTVRNAVGKESNRCIRAGAAGSGPHSTCAGRRSPHAHPPGDLRRDRLAADGRRGRSSSSATIRPTRSSASSIGCWPRPTTASGGRATGWTWPAMPTPRATVFTQDRNYPNAYVYRDWVVRR